MQFPQLLKRWTAIIQAQRDYIDRAFGFFLRNIQGTPNLFIDVPLFCNRNL
jgi:hypothetical protein